MLNITELENWIEQIDILVVVILAIIEIGIDFFGHNQRNYNDTAANIAIAIVYQPETELPIYGLTENIETNNPIKINAIEYQRLIGYILQSKSLKEIW